ncbi:hypothetical protein IAT38_003777 [Cryptococcus sp. DSM 104549]
MSDSAVPSAIQVFRDPPLMSLILSDLEDAHHPLLTVSQLFFDAVLPFLYEDLPFAFCAYRYRSNGAKERYVKYLAAARHVDVPTDMGIDTVVTAFQTFPNAHTVTYGRYTFRRTFPPAHPDDGCSSSPPAPASISYNVKCSLSFDTGKITLDDEREVSNLPNEWKQNRDLALTVSTVLVEGVLSDGIVYAISPDIPLSEADDQAFSKALVSCVQGALSSFGEDSGTTTFSDLLIERPVSLTAVASALTSLAASGIAPPSRLCMYTAYGNFLSLMSSLGPNLSTLTPVPYSSRHQDVELTPEDFINGVDWARFPALRVLQATCRRPDAVDPHPFTDLWPVGPPSAEIEPLPHGDLPVVSIALVYPRDKATMHAQLKHDAAELPRLVEALKVVMPSSRPRFMIWPEPTVGPRGEERDPSRGVHPKRMWHRVFEDAVEQVWGSRANSDEEDWVTSSEEEME